MWLALWRVSPALPIRLYMQADNKEREHIYFRSHADGFAYLKKIGAFKTE